MLELDRRTGSEDLLPLVLRRHIPAQLTTLRFGDAAFILSGPGGRPVLTGIEIKKIGDMLRCMTDGRYSGHQLPGMANAYELRFLVVEGDMRMDTQTGILQTPWGANNGRFQTNSRDWGQPDMGARGFMFSDVTKFLITILLQGGTVPWFTQDREHTAQFLCDLYRWGTAKEWEEHRSHLAFDESDILGQPAAILLKKHSLLRLVAKELPGIGWKKSVEIEKAFGSIHNMANAEVKDWENIAGIGKKIALDLWKKIRGIK